MTSETGTNARFESCPSQAALKQPIIDALPYLLQFLSYICAAARLTGFVGYDPVREARQSLVCNGRANRTTSCQENFK